MWLWDPLNITFRVSGPCSAYLLTRGGNQINAPQNQVTVGEVKYLTFMVANVTKEFDNASMQVIGITTDGQSIVKKFTIHTQGQYWCNNYTMYNTS